MVGQGIHRMDECFTGQTALQKSLSASRSFRWESTSTLYKLYDYTEAVDAMEKNAADRPRIPCLLVSWDNSPGAPRRYHFPKLQSTVIRESSGAAIAKLGENFTVTRFVFLNGWNESAEGNHLEPDQRFGVGYLEELRRVRNPVAGEFGWPKILDNGH